MNRSIEVGLRVTPDERQLMAEVARRDGLALSALVRNLVARRAQEQASVPHQTKPTT
jgi:hypothetical protein